MFAQVSSETSPELIDLNVRLLIKAAKGFRHAHRTAEISMTDKLDDRALDRLFRTARTRNAWTERPVTKQQLRELYDLTKFGPTSGNCCPARFVRVKRAEGRSRLAVLAAPTNAPKTLAAPVARLTR